MKLLQWLSPLAAIDGSNLINLLIQLVVAGLIFWVLWWALGAINPPEPFKKVLTVILVLVAAIFLINILLGLGGHTIVVWH